MRFADLGRLEVRGADGNRAIGTRASAALAALLWFDRPVAAEQLADIVWGDDQPSKTRESLHVLIWRLRRVLEPDRARGDNPTLLVSVPTGYVLLARTHDVDSRYFSELVGEARTLLADGDAQASLDRVDAALRLWRGEPLGDVGDELWARPMVATLLEMRANAQEIRLDALAALGRNDVIVADTERLVAEYPTREGMWARRARSQYATGNQVAALRTLHAARTYLAQELGLEPGTELRRLERQVLHQDPVLTTAPDLAGGARAAAARRPPRPPRPRSSFHGRDDLTGHVRTLLGHERLVTLTGPAGVGKSRLAVEVARASVRTGGEVVLVDLAGAGVLDDVLDDDPGCPMLVVLDNCEHELAGAAAFLERAAPHEGVHVLATSRCPIGAEGEQVVAVAPLPVPSAVAPDVDGDGGCASVELLLARSIAAGADLDADAASSAALRAIAGWSDGLPLALELAAEAVATLGVEPVARRLSDGLPLPSALRAGRPARHRAIDVAVRASYDACEPSAQALLRRLAVLQDPFDLETAARVSTPSPGGDDVAADLAALVHHALVLADHAPAGERSYRILEPIRQFARRVGPAELSPVAPDAVTVAVESS